MNFENIRSDINLQDNKFDRIPPFVGSVEIAGKGVNIFAPFDLVKGKSGNYDNMGVPECTVSKDRLKTRYSLFFIESEQPKVEWNATQKFLKVFGKSEDFKGGSAIIFRASLIAEYQRQIENKVTTHGAAVSFENESGLLILGNQGEGKTTTALNLCLNHNCKLIGNDQVIFGISNNNLEIIGGTKYVTIRKVATQTHLSQFKSLFEEKDSLSAWKTKVTVMPEDINIQTKEGETPLKSIIWIHIDPTMNDSTKIERISPTNILYNLLLSEKLSRTITGITTPLIDDSGTIRALNPSLDDNLTIVNRLDIINKIYEQGFYSVTGSDIGEIIENIQSLIK